MNPPKFNPPRTKMTNNNSTLPRLDILEGLGKHLLEGNLNHEKWTFGRFLDDRYMPNSTYGDSIAELPFLFPDEFEFYNYYRSRKVVMGNVKVCRDTVKSLFGFEKENDPKLKFQNLGDILCWSRYYSEDLIQPTPQKVGKMILDFLKNYRTRYPQAQ